MAELALDPRLGLTELMWGRTALKAAIRTLTSEACRLDRRTQHARLVDLVDALGVYDDHIDAVYGRPTRPARCTRAVGHTGPVPTGDDGRLDPQLVALLEGAPVSWPTGDVGLGRAVPGAHGTFPAGGR